MKTYKKMVVRGQTVRTMAAGLCLLAIVLAGMLSGSEAATLVTYDTSNTSMATTTSGTSPWVLGNVYSSFPSPSAESMGFFGGAQWAYLNGAAPYDPTTPIGGAGLQFGFQLTDNPSGTYNAATPSRATLVTGFTLAGDFGGSRKGLGTVTLHYGSGQTMSLTLPATAGSQTYTFATPITTSYLLFTAEAGSFYNSGAFGTDNNIGINSFSVEGDWLNQGDRNINAGATISSVNSFVNTDAVVNDGRVAVNDTGGGRFWTRDAANPDVVTATYATTQQVTSVGLGLNLDRDRDEPIRVLVSYDGGSEYLTLDGPHLTYGRYALAAPVNTTFLSLTFPTNTLLADWYVQSDASYGITEFQAFGSVPEPSSALLLLVGGLVLWRRCRK